jgi:F0F1-type ATP synthase membrane subunit c/vacuolar-type H+-ATPase subunit K
MTKVKAIRKFIVAAVGIAVAVGVLDSGIAQDVIAAATAILVFVVPND